MIYYYSFIYFYLPFSVEYFMADNSGRLIDYRYSYLWRADVILSIFIMNTLFTYLFVSNNPIFSRKSNNVCKKSSLNSLNCANTFAIISYFSFLFCNSLESLYYSIIYLLHQYRSYENPSFIYRSRP